jgi:cyclopropane-fatty-acyl-phospholipid synthase
MLFEHLLNRFVKTGTLKWINHEGKTKIFSATPTPSITFKTHTKKVERRLCYSPSLALGEGYMDGEITIEDGDIYDFLYWCGLNQQTGEFSPVEAFLNKLTPLIHKIEKHNSILRSHKHVQHHYDITKELYDLFLDKDFQYSCGYFTDVNESLDAAQENKKRHLASKLRIQPGDKVLDIGCGWGGLALYLARETGADVTGLTLSQEQHKVATERAREAGLSHQVRFHLRDYRQETDTYDRIVSVGMFEHVGLKSFPEFFNQVNTLLKEDGIALLHSIGYAHGPNVTDPWIEKYIFPGGYCPALSETIKAIESSNLLVKDTEILYQHYAETLLHWRTRFLKNSHKAQKLMGERFCRMWELYLAGSEAAFRARNLMVFQIQMIKKISVIPLTRDYMVEWEQEHGAPLPTDENYKKVS